MIEFWFDFASTYSYPAAMRIQDVAARHGCAVQWKPFLLGPIFKTQGWSDSPFNIYPVKGRYMWRDLERLSGRWKISIRKPAVSARCVFVAKFAEDQDIADPQVLLRCLRGLTEDPKVVLAAAGAPEAKARARRNTQRAMERGIFGAPTFVVDGELFWGNDQLGTAFEWSRSRE